MEYAHFIITRFNVNIEPTDFPPRLGVAWLSLRFDIFQRFCFPSVRAQTCQDFTWLVLFDEQTPDRFRRIIDAYGAQPNFVPLFCGSYDTVLPTAKTKMRELAPDAPWLLTTRLDNDDGLARNFVRCLRGVADGLAPEQLAPSDTLFINFPNGLQYHEGAVYDFSDATNAFVSLMERPEDPHTVFWVDHPSIEGVAPVIQAETRPLWLQHVHGTNVYNHVRGQLTQDRNPLRDFSLEL